MTKQMLSNLMTAIRDHLDREWRIMITMMWASDKDLLTNDEKKQLINLMLNHPYKNWAVENCFFDNIIYCDFNKQNADDFIKDFKNKFLNKLEVKK